MSETFAHDSVLKTEALNALAPRQGGVYADVTVGGAGHAEAMLLRSSPDGRLIAMDRDENALEAARAKLSPFGDRVEFVHRSFAHLEALLRERGGMRLDGLVADLGVSSPQLDRSERGFSFQEEGPLDMRMDPSQGETAAELLGRLSEKELADTLYTLGEERRSRAVARAVKRAIDEGTMKTTSDLRRAVHRVMPRRGRIDPATRTFQAVRIAVNQELEELETLLKSLPLVLEDDGVAVIISFHSLEDRRVKYAFRDVPELQPLFKKPLTASVEEARANRRARSAKLRAARRLPRGVSR